MNDNRAVRYNWITNISKEEELEKMIYKKFKKGDRYSLSEVKDLLSEMYNTLEITKTPKATDLGKYFKISKTRITLPDKTVVNGFKILEKI